ncbi:flavin reductase [Bradyrhizobium prioriisuperbiae]|uniref:flavin reductase n=1 Tax=Bradyrhizobium prioriisuperbiae TaxID=2854389 RepID=UPI0028E77853|nr:flavin reductase [Bradyrhizobium prioritasuperba]
MVAPSNVHFREAMSRLGAAVNVITSAGAAGRLGFTATAVCSVSDQPPTLVVCMNRGSPQNEAIKKNGVLCVNTLADVQLDLSPVFAGMTPARGEDRFLVASWSSLATGSPVLSDALVSFDCAIDRTIEVGTHSVLFCTVLDVATREHGEPLLYFGRQYCSRRPLISDC